MPSDKEPEADVFRLEGGEAHLLMRDAEGVVYEEVIPGTKEDPFTFRPRNLGDILYGLNKIERELDSEDGSKELTLELTRRCQEALQLLIRAELG
jgi:hypothetical protein